MRVLLAFLLAVLISVPARGASVVSAGKNVIHIGGQIKKGDARKFERLLLFHATTGFERAFPSHKFVDPNGKRPTDDDDYVGAVFLNSTGGEVGEALRIGTLVRRFRLTTVAPLNKSGWVGCRFRPSGENYYRPDGTGRTKKFRFKNSGCACTSACALIWSAGVHRVGTVGFHRPYRTKLTIQNYGKYSEQGTHLLDSVRKYLRGMGVPQWIINKSEQIPFDRLHWTGPKEQVQMFFEPKFEELIRAQCPGAGSTRTMLKARGRKYSRWGKCYSKLLDELAAHEQSKFYLQYMDRLREAGTMGILPAQDAREEDFLKIWHETLWQRER